MTDQNQAFPAQGSDANPQGEHHNNNNNNQTMESLLNEQDLNVDLPQPGEIRTGMIASISPSQILVSIGAKSPRILFDHILPNLIGPLITVATFEMSAMIFYEAGLSFLGLSVPPSVPSWGNMISVGRKYLTTAPWMTAFPGLAIMITSLGMNLLGDWMRDVLDPRMRRVKK